MIGRIRDKIAFKMSRWALIRIILFVACSALILFNSMNVNSPWIGIAASSIFLVASSSAAGDIFFSHEKRFLKEILGLAVYLTAAALLGTTLILGLCYTEIWSIAVVVSVGLILCVASVFRWRVNIQNAPGDAKKSEDKSWNKKHSSLLVLFAVSTTIALYALVLARTGEGVTSVWLTIPYYFLVAFFVSSLSLVALLFFTELHIGLKLSLICLHSFLSHILFVLVWYPGRYGDVWSHLGDAIYIDRTGAFYAHHWLYTQQLLADIVKYKSQYALVVLFRRLFTLDIYWVDVFFVPILWSVLVPVLSYKLAETMTTGKSKMFPLLAAVGTGLIPSLIGWGAGSVPNSLGFILFLATITLLLYWVNSRSKRVLASSILASAAAFFAHPQVGLYALSLVFGGVVIQSRMRTTLKVISLPVIASAYLVVAFLQNATFSLEGLLSLESLTSFQSDLTYFLIMFGFLGLVFSIRGKIVKGKISIMLFVFYAAMAASYYISNYGMTNAPVPRRVLPMMDLLLVPFVALGLVITADFLKKGIGRGVEQGTHSLRKLRMTDARLLALWLICLFVSLQLTFALYQAYPRKEITNVQPAWYEVDAVYYINSTAPGRYIVLCDTNFAALASGLLGIDYAYGAVAPGIYGMPEYSFWTMKIASQMSVNPSVSLLESAMLTGRTGAAYIVVSVRSSDFEGIVQRLSKEFQVDRVFGDGKLYVFKYVSSIVPIEGPGPKVKVSFEDASSQDIQTIFNYFIRSAAKYKVVLSGHSSYNITGYPTYWTFFDVKVNDQAAQFDKSSDVNSFIYINGLTPADTLEVNWAANGYYPNAGWKDDSFKYDWHTHPTFRGTISPNITSDGNVLSLWWNFSTYFGKYQYYYYVRNMTVSTNDYSHILVRWRSSGPIAAVAIVYDDSSSDAIVPFGSDNTQWTLTEARLRPDKKTAFIMVGITNIQSGPRYDVADIQTLDVDFILAAAP